MNQVLVSPHLIFKNVSFGSSTAILALFSLQIRPQVLHFSHYLRICLLHPTVLFPHIVNFPLTVPNFPLKHSALISSFLHLTLFSFHEVSQLIRQVLVLPNTITSQLDSVLLFLVDSSQLINLPLHRLHVRI